PAALGGEKTAGGVESPRAAGGSRGPLRSAVTGGQPAATACSVWALGTTREVGEEPDPRSSPLQREAPRRSWAEGASGALARAGSGAGGAEETFRDDEVFAGELVDRGLAQPQQRGVDAAAQDVEDVPHPGLPVGGQSPQVGAADHDRFGSQGECF